jgi:hypothetical protein
MKSEEERNILPSYILKFINRASAFLHSLNLNSMNVDRKLEVLINTFQQDFDVDLMIPLEGEEFKKFQRYEFVLKLFEFQSDRVYIRLNSYFFLKMNFMCFKNTMFDHNNDFNHAVFRLCCCIIFPDYIKNYFVSRFDANEESYDLTRFSIMNTDPDFVSDVFNYSLKCSFKFMFDKTQWFECIMFAIIQFYGNCGPILWKTVV